MPDKTKPSQAKKSFKAHLNNMPIQGMDQPLTKQEFKTKRQEARLTKKKANIIERNKRKQNRQEFRDWKKEVKGTPASYKISEPTYTLPGEGSRENYSEGTFREDNRAMQAGLITPNGFGDLSADKAGSTPALSGDFSGMGGAQLTTVPNIPSGGGNAPGGTTNINVNPASGGGNEEEEEDGRQPLDLKHSGYSAGAQETFEGMPVGKLQ